ncbi:MAG: hypothetical protein E7451_05015 [Ruminococcaceae bacterium]|nr:hypothetical protein [Oscillospiraceae bacterium]
MERLSEEIRRVLQDMIESEDGEYVLHPRGKDLVIENRYDLCFVWFATLAEVRGLPEEAEDGWTLWCSEIRADGDAYVLLGEINDPESDEFVNVELRFSDVKVELKAVHTDPAQAHAAPWWVLAMLAEGVIRKSEVAPRLMNDRERELLPLLREVTALAGWRGMQDGKDRMEFPLLRQRIDPKLHRLLDRLEGKVSDWKRYFKDSNKLQTQLNRSRYEHIWRGIYDELAASQAEYPMKSAVPAQVRHQIETQLQALGYSGCYPDFRKSGAIRGLRVGKSRGQSYFVCHEKNAVFHIHCREYACQDGSVQVEFICGTELLRKDEKPGDILSCMFSAGGRRLIRSGSSFLSDDLGDLERKIGIAAKRAELRQLDKQERKSEGTMLPVQFLFLALAACGVLAGLATGFFLAVGSLVTALLFGWSEIPAMLHEVAWREIFWFAWALFGGAFVVSWIIGERTE